MSIISDEILVQLVNIIREKNTKGVSMAELRSHFSYLIRGDIKSDLIETPIYNPLHQLMEWGLIEAWYRGNRLASYHFQNQLRHPAFWRYQLFSLMENFEKILQELQNVRFYPTHQLFNLESTFGFRFSGTPYRYFRLQDLEPPDVFVAMPFLKELEVVYERSIKPICKQLGLTVRRADDISKGGAIIDQIWTLILESRLVIVDCSFRNPNVFYELGLAQANGKLTLLTTKDLRDIPFDIAHHRVLKYALTQNGLSKFRLELKDTIPQILAGAVDEPYTFPE